MTGYTHDRLYLLNLPPACLSPSRSTSFPAITTVQSLIATRNNTQVSDVRRIPVSPTVAFPARRIWRSYPWLSLVEPR
jgi:hypothetical protein